MNSDCIGCWVDQVNRLNKGIHQRRETFNFDQINQWLMSELSNFEQERPLFIRLGSWTVKRNLGIILGDFTMLEPISAGECAGSVFHYHLNLTIDWKADLNPDKGEVSLVFRLNQPSTLDEGGSVFINPSTTFEFSAEIGYVTKFSEYFLEANDYTSISIHRQMDHYIAKQEVEYMALPSIGQHIENRNELVTSVNNKATVGRVCNGIQRDSKPKYLESNHKNRSSKKKHQKCRCEDHKCRGKNRK